MNNREKKRFDLVKQALMIAPHIDKEGLKEFKDKKRVFIPITIEGYDKVALLWSFEHNTVIAIRYQKKVFGEFVDDVIELFR